MDIASLSLTRERCRSCIMDIVLFPCFHHFMDGHSLSLSMQSPIDREICRSHITDIVPFPCFHHFTYGHSHSLPLSFSLSLYLSVETLILVFNCCHFATDCLYEYVQFTIYCIEAQPISAISPNTCTLKLHLIHNTERPTKWSGHGKMSDPPWRTSTYERPFTQEGSYLV